MNNRKKFRLLFLILSLCMLFAARTFAFDEFDDSDLPRNKIVNLNGFKFYYDKTGTPVTKKFVTIKDKTYYFDKQGIMKESEIFDVGKHTYYANAKGIIAKNKFVTIGKKRYFFDKNGYRKTGWIDYKSHTYYVPLTGKAYKSEWKKIGKYYYYFTDSYYIRKNKWVGKYYVDGQGHRVTNAPSKNAKKKVLNMKTLMQNPELPTGCESVALTMVLRYYGFDIGKTTIASSYMPRSDSNFVTAFMGNPFSSGGCGIYAPGLTNTANKYLSAKKSQLRAKNISGTEFSKLNSYIDKGIPVIVWNTMYMQNPVGIYSINTLGKTWTFYQSEHCVVFCGYDPANKKVLIDDPLSGLVWRSTSAFTNLYNKLGKMAVVIS